MNKNMMLTNKYSKALILFVSLLSFFSFSSAHAKSRTVPVGKPVYCDTSTGRTVLNNGSYSQLYCRYSAIMNYQTLHGCCSWAGGVLAVKNGDVICKDGSLSSVCSLQNQSNNPSKNSDGSVNVNNSQ